MIFQIARELLRKSAGSLCAPAFEDVRECGDGNSPDVQAEVAVELRVLRRDNGLPQQRIDVVVADDHAPLRRKLPNQLIAGGIDSGDGARRIVVERRYLRQVARVGEEDAAQDAQERCHQEQADDRGIAGDFDDDVRHA